MLLQVNESGQPHRPIVVGVVNCTPDSFFDGGAHADLLAHARRLVAQGADWLDVGGESTRPGADAVDAEAEWARIAPVVEALSAEVVISVDTSKPAVAARAAAAGAVVLNDVTGLRDAAMTAISERFLLTVVMHMRGTPRSMSALTDYADLTAEVRAHLVEAAGRARSPQVAIDPGIGFAKTARQSLRLLRDTDALVATGLPVYIGASRKSFIGRTLRLPDPEDRLPGSLAAVAAAWQRGARIFRVHDVAETRQHVDLLYAIDRSGELAAGQQTP
ncbi:MAG: dihydropteroate synthase [Myxococcota bacterium]|nr:dihydropteroate synthase [Myxococcota bacterium]MEC8424854.1 dihydropteroate synthase [Myxococcota bacterium]